VPGQTITVVGAAGGAGASTLATLLARRRARDGRTVLVDLDPGAGGLDVLLGVEDRPGLRWSHLQHVRGELDPRELHGALPVWDGVEVLSADPAFDLPDDAVVGAVVRALAADDATVVVDLPGRLVRTADRWAVGSGDDDAAVLVTAQDVRGVAAGLAVLRWWDRPPATHLVLRRRPSARVAPAQAAHVLGLPLAGLLPADRSVAAAADRGLGPLVRPRGRLDRSLARIDARCRPGHHRDGRSGGRRRG
jgi:secretion/DNA translocation related CpaE-like protein